MELYYMSMCFIFGIVLGSFYNVVGYRVPKHQSLIYPSSHCTMFLLKKLGDFLFKKESMGGGDIKLLFTFGLVFGWQMSIVSIFMASFIALPFAIYYTMKYKNQKYVEDDEIPENSIPFGPFLAVSAILITLTQMDISMLLQMFM